MATDVSTRRPALTRKTLQVVIGVLALLLVVGGALLLTTRGSSAAEPATDPALRNEVKRVASAFAANVNTYSADDIKSYRKNVEPLLTPTFEKSFSKSMDDIVKQMQSAKLESKGEVKAAGVSSLDEDSAVVLVVCDADVSSTHGDRERHFRWRIDLVRGGEDGAWLVDEFKPV